MSEDQTLTDEQIEEEIDKLQERVSELQDIRDRRRTDSLFPLLKTAAWHFQNETSYILEFPWESTVAIRAVDDGHHAHFSFPEWGTLAADDGRFYFWFDQKHAENVPKVLRELGVAVYFEQERQSRQRRISDFQDVLNKLTVFEAAYNATAPQG